MFHDRLWKLKLLTGTIFSDYHYLSCKTCHFLGPSFPFFCIKPVPSYWFYSVTIHFFFRTSIISFFCDLFIKIQSIISWLGVASVVFRSFLRSGNLIGTSGELWYSGILELTSPLPFFPQNKYQMRIATLIFLVSHCSPNIWACLSAHTDKYCCYRPTLSYARELQSQFWNK